ncbi:conserved hypothetical protein [sediment metagenome]|uniref:Glycosyl hydrolase n=1 Tax=sediment metagenome TaxID=749907 RepID=D9PGA8_9ZZZZ
MFFNEVESFRAKRTKSAIQANYNWRLLGPIGEPSSSRSEHGIGRVNIYSGFDPTNPDVYWAGSAGGGVWKSTNAGRNWFTFPFTQFLSLGVSDIGISPSNPNIVYVATGDADGSSATRSPGSIGVIKTTNGGASWTTTNLNFYLLDNKILGRLLVDPDDPNIVIVASFDGIYKTIDGGSIWAKKSNGTFIDMEFKTDDETMYMLPHFPGAAPIKYSSPLTRAIHGKK